jgi:hypothetical protein
MATFMHREWSSLGKRLPTAVRSRKFRLGNSRDGGTLRWSFATDDGVTA